MFKRIKRGLSGERGGSPWIAVFAITVLLAFTAMAVDLGVAYLETSKLQSALDAGALAGANHLPDTAAATAAAINCVQLNGYTASDVTVNFSDSNSKIKLSAAKEVDTMFLKVLGINEWNINRGAAATKFEPGGTSGIFGYRIFSGSEYHTLTLESNCDILGNIHSNGGFNAKANVDVQGTVASVSSYDAHKNADIAHVNYPAQVLEMPDFSQAIAQMSPMYPPEHYQEHANASKYNGVSNTTLNGSKYITGNFSFGSNVTLNGDLFVNGNLTLSSNVEINGSIYVTGNATVSSNADINGPLYAAGWINIQSNATVNGYVIANGNITISSNVDVDNEPFCIYSANGNISLSSNIDVTGLVYAPKGDVTLSSNVDIYGGVIGYRVFCDSNVELKGDYDPDEIDYLPKSDAEIKLVE